MMILRELEHRLDKLFSKSRAESWDNSGLQIGSLDSRIKKIMVALDVNNHVCQKAIKENIDLIITHHPLIFDPFKSITDRYGVGKILLDLIKKGIAVYSAHTNYDIMADGLAGYYSEKLDLEGVSTIQPYSQQWYKMTVFVPSGHEQEVREGICRAGGGKWGNYSCCTFNSRGQGTFYPREGSQPFIGKVGEISFADEVRIECIVEESRLNEVIEEALKAHPYQQPAYDVYRLENSFENGGLGIKGSLKQSIKFKQLLGKIKKELETDNFKWAADSTVFDPDKEVNSISVVWGSANSLKDKLLALDSEVVIVGEIGYHNACDVIGSGKAVIEMGHGSSEKWAIEDMYCRLKDYFKQEQIDISLTKSKKGYMCWRYYIG